MGKLALTGGEKTVTDPWPTWPIWDERDIEAVAEVIRSGKWGSFAGDRVHRFQERFAAFQDAAFGFCVTSGTSALEVALRAAGVSADDEVIVPPYTFIATATAPLLIGAVPVFVDVEPDTYNLDPDCIEPALTERTRAVCPVHVAGRAANLERINAVARKHNLAVVTDACHCWGAEYKGKKLGAQGDVGAFSFQSSKNLNCGEGGFVTTNDERLGDHIYSLVNIGRRRGGGWYEHPLLAGNARMTEFQAALLDVQLDRLPEQMDRRDAAAARLHQRIANIEGITPQAEGPDITRHGRHGYLATYDPAAFGGLPRAKFLEALHAEGVPFSGGWTLPLYKQDLFLHAHDADYPVGRPYRDVRVDYAKVHCPVTEHLCEHNLWLSQQFLLADPAMMDGIADAIEKIQANYGELL